MLATYADMLIKADATMLTGWLWSATRAAADGFDQEFGLLSLGPAQVAVEQGWIIDDTCWVHSTGVLTGGCVVVLLGTFPESAS